MNPLQDIFLEHFNAFKDYVNLPDAYYHSFEFYHEDEETKLKNDPMQTFLFDHYLGLVDFGPLAELATANELDPAAYKLQLEKKILASVKTALENDISRNHWFAKKTDWKPLDQILTVFRLKELKSVGITRRSGRRKGKGFDVSTLAATFFGKQIMNGLKLGRRKMLNQEELDLLRAECTKLKLTLPEIIEPTTTEKFFADAEAPDSSED